MTRGIGIFQAPPQVIHKYSQSENRLRKDGRIFKPESLELSLRRGDTWRGPKPGLCRRGASVGGRGDRRWTFSDRPRCPEEPRERLPPPHRRPLHAFAGTCLLAVGRDVPGGPHGPRAGAPRGRPGASWWPAAHIAATAAARSGSAQKQPRVRGSRLCRARTRSTWATLENLFQNAWGSRRLSQMVCKPKKAGRRGAWSGRPPSRDVGRPGSLRLQKA